VDVGAAAPLAATNSDYYGSAGSTNDCGGYATTTGSVGTGMPSAGAGAWLLNGAVSCASPARYYCLGVDYIVPLVYPKAAGRAAFLSSGTWNPGGTIGGMMGLGSADALCRQEATNANLASPNTFLAAMSTSTQAASARFSINGAPWVRPDGIPLASTAAAFFDSTMLLDAPLNTSANSSVYQTYWVWTGSTTPAVMGTAVSTCTDWTSASATTTPIAGVSGYTDSNRWDVIPNPYSNPAGLRVEERAEAGREREVPVERVLDGHEQGRPRTLVRRGHGQAGRGREQDPGPVVHGDVRPAEDEPAREHARRRAGEEGGVAMEEEGAEGQLLRVGREGVEQHDQGPQPGLRARQQRARRHDGEREQGGTDHRRPGEHARQAGAGTGEAPEAGAREARVGAEGGRAEDADRQDPDAHRPARPQGQQGRSEAEEHPELERPAPSHRYALRPRTGRQF